MSLVFMISSILSFSISAYADDTVNVKGKLDYDYAYSVLELVNKERSAKGLSKLVMDLDLLESAMIRATELSVKFSHDRPNGTSCFTVCEWNVSVGENIAAGQDTPSIVMNSWMKSQGHRENILTDSFKRMGVGCFIAESNDCEGFEYYWVQIFAGDKPLEKNVSLAPSQSQIKVTSVISLNPNINTVIKTDSTGAINKTTSVTKKKSSKKTISKPKKTVITSIKKKSKGFVIKWRTVPKVKGYQIQYALNKKFTKGKKIITVKGSKKSTKTIKGLKSKKKYYVRVRTYNSKGVRKAYSPWTKTKTIKTK